MNVSVAVGRGEGMDITVDVASGISGGGVPDLAGAVDATSDWAIVSTGEG